MVKQAITYPKKNLLLPINDTVTVGTVGKWSTIWGNEWNVSGYKATLNATGQYHEIKLIVPCKPNTTYTFSLSTLNNGFIAIRSRNYSLVQTNQITFSDNQKVGQYTTTSDACFIDFSLTNRPTSGIIEYENFQLEEGSTATPFEPYSPVNKSSIRYPKKNLVNPNNLLIREGFGANYINDIGNNRITSTVAENNIFGYLIPVTPGKRYTPYAVLGGGATSYRVYGYTDKPVYSFTDGASNGFMSFGLSSFICPSTINWIVLGFHSANIQGSYVENVQLEEGSTATAFESYSAVNKSANLIYPTVTITSDFTGKVSGSVVENPHVFLRRGNPVMGTPLTPSQWIEGNTSQINSIKTLDGNLSEVTVGTSGSIPQQMFSFNVVELLERQYGSIGNTLSEKITKAKQMITGFTCNWTGFGSSPTGNKATLYTWAGAWASALANTSSTPTLIQRKFNDGVDEGCIDSNGFLHFLVAADPSDGVISSMINTDHIQLSLVTTSPFAINKPAL